MIYQTTVPTLAPAPILAPAPAPLPAPAPVSFKLKYYSS